MRMAHRFTAHYAEHPSACLYSLKRQVYGDSRAAFCFDIALVSAGVTCRLNHLWVWSGGVLTRARLPKQPGGAAHIRCGDARGRRAA